MNVNSFPSALNIYTPALDRNVCQWAIGKGILDPIRQKVWADQKINWFAGYLFPNISSLKLEKVMKLFCCLFILDDLLDSLTPDQSIELLENLLNGSQGNRSEIDKNSFPLSLVLSAVIEPISKFGNTDWELTFDNYWHQYLEAQKWEVCNRHSGVLPTFSEYKERRMDSSGAYLALHLLKYNWKKRSCAANLIDYKVARIICLSNDAISMDKERDAGDFHNELLLLQHYIGCSSKLLTAYVDSELKKLVSEVSELMGSKEYFFDKERMDDAETWIDDLQLLVGGCQYWSQQDTLRYGASVNGCIKSN